jgi:hypothetical protein
METEEFESEARRTRKQKSSKEKKKRTKRRYRFVGPAWDYKTITNQLFRQNPQLEDSVEFVTSGQVDGFITPPNTATSMYSNLAEVRHAPDTVVMNLNQFCKIEGIALPGTSDFAMSKLVDALSPDEGDEEENEMEAASSAATKRGRKKKSTKKKRSKSKKLTKKGKRKSRKRVTRK